MEPNETNSTNLKSATEGADLGASYPKPKTTRAPSDRTYASAEAGAAPVREHDFTVDPGKVDSARLKIEIPGWGIDLPRERRVGEHKMGDFSPSDNGAHWTKPDQQEAHVTILKSPDADVKELTPVFGTTFPPKGLSGVLRTYAYSVGEGYKRRWMTLLLADRVDVVESTVSELLFGFHADPEEPKKLRPAAIVAIAGVAALSVAGAIYFGARVRANRNSGKKTKGTRLAKSKSSGERKGGSSERSSVVLN